MPSRTPPEALDALRERLRATQEAAQRLADEAASGSGIPPAGWDVPGRADEANAELEALVRMLAMLRDVVPPELRAQLAELVRQLLVFVRAVLDWWIERIEPGPRGDEPEVEDIPIT
ncbi:MAG TPA: hypothetical protein VHF89_07075 [Solirubrobacteraceae bacterium]|nr:hypothetical protein [Solirubrobacteraceae bacterium]